MNSLLHKMLALPGPYPERAVIEAIKRMSMLVRSSALYMVFMSLPVVLVFWGEVPASWLVLWWALALTVPCGQYLLARTYFAREARIGPPDIVWTTGYARRLSVFSLVDGIVWGTACLSILAVQSLGHQMLVLVLTIGNAAGSIFATSFWPATQYYFVIPAIGLAILALVLTGDPGALGVAAGLVVYLVVLHFMVRDAYKTTMDGIEFQFENQELVEKLRAQTQLAEQANAAKSKFLAAASHDLRQPLHALGLFAAALRERVTSAEALPLLGHIDQSVTALGGLLDALLDLSKLDAGLVKARTRDVNLAPLLARLTREYEPQAQAKALTWYCRESETVVQTDPVLLETMLRNLIGNALRYSEKGGVRIDCTHESGVARIDVSDTGIGIAPEHHRDIFREFFQLHNPERDRTKGLGLGLAIVERLNLILGHRLELRSAPGEGTTFTLQLPLGDRAKAREAAEPQFEDWAAHLASITVLIIDDDTSVLEGMRELLESWGYRVVTAASLDEALGMLDEAPNAIIADYRLQNEQTGTAAIHEIRRRFGPAIPALIITGDTAAQRLDEIAKEDIAFLHKPTPPGKLRAFLRSAVTGA